jgi:hypothetical protein
VERKLIVFGQKSAFSLSKAYAALKKQTVGCSGKSYRELERKILVHHNTVKKYLRKMGVHCTAKKSAPKITLDAKLFLCKIDLQMRDGYLTVESNRNVFMSLIVI